MKNVSWLLRVEDIPDWPALVAELGQAGKQAGGPGRLIWDRCFRARSVSDGVAPVAPDPAANAPGSEMNAPGCETHVVHALHDIIKDSSLKEEAGFQELSRRCNFGLRLWQLLTDPLHGGEACRIQCNRQLVEAAFAGIIPSWKPDMHKESYFLAADEIADWKTAAGKLLAETKKAGTPGQTIWQLLPAPSRAALTAVAAGNSGPDAIAAFGAGINEVLTGLPLLLFDSFFRMVEAKHQ